MNKSSDLAPIREWKYFGRNGTLPTPAPPTSSAPTQPDVETVADDDPARGLSNAVVARAVARSGRQPLTINDRDELLVDFHARNLQRTADELRRIKKARSTIPNSPKVSATRMASTITRWEEQLMEYRGLIPTLPPDASKLIQEVEDTIVEFHGMLSLRITTLATKHQQREARLAQLQRQQRCRAVDNAKINWDTSSETPLGLAATGRPPGTSSSRHPICGTWINGEKGSSLCTPPCNSPPGTSSSRDSSSGTWKSG